MPMDATSHLIALLNSLAQRARKPGKPDLSPAISLVNDLSRLTVRCNTDDIRSVQAAVAGVRENLEYSEGAPTPQKALIGIESHSYLAGALWAINETMTARLETPQRVSTGGRQTRKSQISKLILAAMKRGDVTTPGALLETITEALPSARLDEVSRAMTELLKNGLVESVAPEPGTDRRPSYFVLTGEGRSMARAYATRTARVKKGELRKKAAATRRAQKATSGRAARPAR